MKKLFYTGIAGLVLFEILNVYFIMPMPGSQQMQSIGTAYFLHTHRWIFRAVFVVLMLFGAWRAFRSSKWWAVSASLLAVVATYILNFQMAADSMFAQPETLVLAAAPANTIKPDRLVLGIELNGQAKAYPIQLLAYHHQVLDSVGGKPVMVTYCSVCRSGRVFEPVVAGRPEAFRLVGMDHFNAMFEDATTKSWWRQATGEAIAGKLAGQTLPELASQQTSLAKWLTLYPNSLVMQPDKVFKEKYDSLGNYDVGKGRSDLTRTDSLSWKDKSWVVGVAVGRHSKAFDWNRLKRERVVNTAIGNVPVVLALAADDKSFFAFQRSESVEFALQNDTLKSNGLSFNLKGEKIGGADKNVALTKINAYQEFWHSWRTFHPETEKY